MSLPISSSSPSTSNAVAVSNVEFVGNVSRFNKEKNDLSLEHTEFDAITAETGEVYDQLCRLFQLFKHVQFAKNDRESVLLLHMIWEEFTSLLEPLRRKEQILQFINSIRQIEGAEAREYEHYIQQHRCPMYGGKSVHHIQFINQLRQRTISSISHAFNDLEPWLKQAFLGQLGLASEKVDFEKLKLIEVCAVLETMAKETSPINKCVYHRQSAVLEAYFKEMEQVIFDSPEELSIDELPAFPDELFMKVFEYFNPRDVAQFRFVSRGWAHQLKGEMIIERSLREGCQFLNVLMEQLTIALANDPEVTGVFQQFVLGMLSILCNEAELKVNQIATIKELHAFDFNTLNLDYKQRLSKMLEEVPDHAIASVLLAMDPGGVAQSESRAGMFIRLLARFDMIDAKEAIGKLDNFNDMFKEYLGWIHLKMKCGDLKGAVTEFAHFYLTFGYQFRVNCLPDLEKSLVFVLNETQAKLERCGDLGTYARELFTFWPVQTIYYEGQRTPGVWPIEIAFSNFFKQLAVLLVKKGYYTQSLEAVQRMLSGPAIESIFIDMACCAVENKQLSVARWLLDRVPTRLYPELAAVGNSDAAILALDAFFRSIGTLEDFIKIVENLVKNKDVEKLIPPFIAIPEHLVARSDYQRRYHCKEVIVNVKAQALQILSCKLAKQKLWEQAERTAVLITTPKLQAIAYSQLITSLANEVAVAPRAEAIRLFNTHSDQLEDPRGPMDAIIEAFCVDTAVRDIFERISNANAFLESVKERTFSRTAWEKPTLSLRSHGGEKIAGEEQKLIAQEAVNCAKNDLEFSVQMLGRIKDSYAFERTLATITRDIQWSKMTLSTRQQTMELLLSACSSPKHQERAYKVFAANLLGCKLWDEAEYYLTRAAEGSEQWDMSGKLALVRVEQGNVEKGLSLLKSIPANGYYTQWLQASARVIVTQPDLEPAALSLLAAVPESHNKQALYVFQQIAEALVSRQLFPSAEKFVNRMDQGSEKSKLQKAISLGRFRTMYDLDSDRDVPPVIYTSSDEDFSYEDLSEGS